MLENVEGTPLAPFCSMTGGELNEVLMENSLQTCLFFSVN